MSECPATCRTKANCRTFRRLRALVVNSAVRHRAITSIAATSPRVTMAVPAGATHCSGSQTTPAHVGRATRILDLGFQLGDGRDHLLVRIPKLCREQLFLSVPNHGGMPCPRCGAIMQGVFLRVKEKAPARLNLPGCRSRTPQRRRAGTQNKPVTQ